MTMSLSGSSSMLPGAAQEAKLYNGFLVMAAAFLLFGFVFIEVKLVTLYNVLGVFWATKLGG